MVLSKIVTTSMGMKISKKLVVLGDPLLHFHDFVHKITKSKIVNLVMKPRHVSLLTILTM